MPDGELALGDWGEGFVDRRHPHTYLHELVLSADDLLGARDGAASLSLSARQGLRAVRHRRPDGPARSCAIPSTTTWPRSWSGPSRSPRCELGPCPAEAGSVQRRRARASRAVAADRRTVRRLLGRAGSRRYPMPGLELQGSYAQRPFARAPARGGHRPGQVEPVGALVPAGGGASRCTAWSSGPGPRRRTASSSSTASWPKVHGPRAAIVSSTGSSGPSGRRRSGSAGSGRCGPTWRTRFSASRGGRSTRRATRSTRSATGRCELRPLVEVSLRHGSRKVGGGLFDVEEPVRPGSLLVGERWACGSAPGMPHASDGPLRQRGGRRA